MKMKLKKGLVTVLAVMMVLTALPAFAFAETAEGDTEPEKIPNFLGSVMLDNYDCREIDSLANLNLEIQITSKSDPQKTFSVPLAYDAEWNEYYVETCLDQAAVPVMIDEILAAQDAAEKELGIDEETIENMTEEEYDSLDFEALGKALLEKTFAGYTVMVNGLGKDSHFRAELFDGGVETGADQIAAFELMVALLGPEEGFAEGQAPTTMMELMDYAVQVAEKGKYATYEEWVLAEYGPEEAAIMIAEIEAADQLLTMARNGEYPNQLIVSMKLLCDCLPLIEYEVYHQYLVEKDGKLVEIDCIDELDFLGDEVYWLEGEEGQEIYSDDFVRTVYEGKVKKYAGKTFEYVGSYDPWCDWHNLEADLSGDELEEYVLSEDYDYDGFVLRYVLKEDAGTAGAQDTDSDMDKDLIATGAEAAPLTGDDAPLAGYAVLLMTAFTAFTSMFVLKLKRKQ